MHQCMTYTTHVWLRPCHSLAEGPMVLKSAYVASCHDLKKLPTCVSAVSSQLVHLSSAPTGIAGVNHSITCSISQSLHQLLTRLCLHKSMDHRPIFQSTSLPLKQPVTTGLSQDCCIATPCFRGVLHTLTGPVLQAPSPPSSGLQLG